MYRLRAHIRVAVVVSVLALTVLGSGGTTSAGPLPQIGGHSANEAFSQALAEYEETHSVSRQERRELKKAFLAAWNKACTKTSTDACAWTPYVNGSSYGVCVIPCRQDPWGEYNIEVKFCERAPNGSGWCVGIAIPCAFSPVAGRRSLVVTPIVPKSTLAAWTL